MSEAFAHAAPSALSRFVVADRALHHAPSAPSGVQTMNFKPVFFTLILIVIATGVSAQRQPRPSPPAAKPLAARLLVQGTYEETYQGTT